MEQPALNQTVPTPVQPAVSAAPRTRGFDKRYLFLVLIVVGIVGGFFAATRQPETVVLPTPTDTPTPTPKAKPVVPFATESAYMDITVRLATLSGAIQSLQITDTTLSPPTIELPLGFPNQ